MPACLQVTFNFEAPNDKRLSVFFDVAWARLGKHDIINFISILRGCTGSFLYRAHECLSLRFT